MNSNIILKELINKEQLNNRIKEIANELDIQYKNSIPVMIGIMRGGIYFLADLTREMSIPLEIDLMAVKSYGLEKTSSGELEILKDLQIDITDRDVIVIEDIIDSGYTIQFLRKYLMKKKAKSIKVLSMFLKSDSPYKKDDSDLIGFVIDSGFLVGYGLDFANKYSNLKSLYEIID